MLRVRRSDFLRKSMILLATVALACLCSCARKPRMDDASMTSKIDEIFAPLADTKSPGFAILVRKDGRVLFERGYGARDLRTFAPVDAETNFRLASCTKQFTAMATMLLVHNGKLRYEDKLTDAFPDFPDYGKNITIRSLLNHTSGLQDYEALMDKQERRSGPRWNEENQIQDSEVLALLKQQTTTKFPPGTQWAYSNSGYVVLGLVVAKVSGKGFGEFLRERIFASLKMDHTLAYEKGKNEIANRAFGHTKAGTGWKQTDQSPTSATLGDGGVYSSLADMAKWDAALAQHSLLSENEMQPALTPVKLADGSQPKWPANTDGPAGTPVSYGFGWFLDDYWGVPRMWHYGDTMGFHTYIERFPANKITIIVLCNRTDLDASGLAEKIANLYLEIPRM
jgi:CubicO group peptidase (beta-lactamase class C family)